MRSPLFGGNPRALVERRRARRPRLEAVERRVLLSTFTVRTTADDGEGSLRWAIVQANRDDGPTRIEFDLPGEGARTIQLTAALEPLLRPVTIDGRSQPGYDGLPLIRLDGSNLPAGANGLVVTGGESLVAGLVVTGFPGAGIVLTGGGGNLVASSYVGVDPSGGRAAPNGVGVLIAGSSRNMIGGAGGDGNLISGNAGAGIKIIPAAVESVGNLIVGNRIGTDLAGGLAIGNQGGGVVVAGGRGGLISGNQISGNRGAGLSLSAGAADNAVAGNVIGLTAEGHGRLGNQGDGILVDSAPRNQIGGLSTEEANQISGNQGSGVRARGDSAGLVVQGNQIGTDAAGQLALGNLGDGVTLASGSSMIGGLEAGAGNIIAHNGVGSVGSGVRLVGSVAGDAILSNSIYDNAGLGIDLGNGPTPNRPPGEGPGPNNWQNHPILTAAQSDGVSARATGRLSAAPSQTYIVQIYWTDAPDPTGFGEGRRLLASLWVPTNAAGEAEFTINAPLDASGGYLSATATDAEGNTSEFAQSVLALPVADLSVSMTATPSPAEPGAPITFTMVATNQGNLSTSGVALNAWFPSTATVVSASSTRGAAMIGDGATASVLVGSLAPGESAILTVIVQPPAGFAGDFTGTARATMNEIDARPEDNEAHATVRIDAPEPPPPPAEPLKLALAIVPPSAVYEQSTFQYALTVSNDSSRAAADVALSAPLPSGLAFVSAKTSWGAAAAFDSGRVVATLEELPAGATATLTILVRPTAGAGADLPLSGGLACPDLDPDAGAEPATFTARVLPAVNLGVRPQPAAESIRLGDAVVWTVNVWNSGPSPASGVVLRLPTAGAGAILKATATQGTVRTTADGIIVTLGTIAPGSSAIVQATLSPTTPGLVSLVATVAADQHDLNPADNVSSAGLTVLNWPGSIQFGPSTPAVPETIGVATIPVERTGGSLGAVTIRYRTAGGSAVAGLDYQPVSGVLAFGPGETLKYVSIPILANPHGRGDSAVNLVLDSPTGGAVLGGRSALQLTIRDLDPDVVAPQVAAVRLLGGPGSITGLSIVFTEPLNPATALNGSAHQLIDLGPSGVLGGAGNQPLPYNQPTYDPATQTITLTPLQPLAAGRNYALILAGSGSRALTDLAGNPLAGNSDGAAGVDYVSLFTRGAAIGYTDSKGNLVSYRATGGGFLDLTRTAAGDARVLTLQGGIPGRTTLTGSVTRQRGRGDGVTTIDAIEGLGQFGQIRVALKSPPFLVKQLPFNLTVGRPLPVPSPIVPPRAPAPIRPAASQVVRPAARPLPVRQPIVPPRLGGLGMRRP